MSKFAIYIHNQAPHILIHRIKCGHVRQRDRGNVTKVGYWEERNSLDAVRRLRNKLRRKGYRPGAKNGGWYCMHCNPTC